MRIKNLTTLNNIINKIINKINGTLLAWNFSELYLGRSFSMIVSITKLYESVENSNKSLINAISSLTVAINSLNRLVEDKDKKDKPE